MKSVFINLGRFDVIGLSYRLAETDANEFIGKIREYKQQNVAIPEKFQMGKEVFTEGDMNRLIGSFIVVIPAVSFFDVKTEEKKTLTGRQTTGYSAQIKTSFTFIKVDEAKTFAQFFVETSGSDEDRERAIQSAINAIPARLEFEITKVPDFTLKTGILEVNFGKVVLELGQNMGIKKGYEFAILDARVLDSGFQFDSESGLLVVKEVGENVSMATILYGSPQVGDQLKEVPRFGTEVTPYLDVLISPWSEDESIYSLFGFAAVATKGFYDIRPLVGMEFPLPFAPEDSLLPAMWVFGFPFNLYVGGEYNIYIRRLQVRPHVGFGFGMIVPWLLDTDEPIFTHLGGFAGAQFSFLVSRDYAVSADVGYKLWYGIYDALLTTLDITRNKTSYGGVRLAVGISRKL